MIKILYKIKKLGDENTLYIGSTEQSLEERLIGHKYDARRFPSRLLYTWFDNNCYIEKIQEIEGNTQLDFEKIEWEWIKRLRKEGFTLMNFEDGKTKQPEYIKINDTKQKAKRNKDYMAWQMKIYYEAKKEGLTSKEYRLKYNIPDYTGEKKIN
jgi:hypothetical protein